MALATIYFKLWLTTRRKKISDGSVRYQKNYGCFGQ